MCASVSVSHKWYLKPNTSFFSAISMMVLSLLLQLCFVWVLCFLNSCVIDVFIIIIIIIRVFFHGHWPLTGQQGEGEEDLFYYTLPFPPAHEQTFILQLCTWDDYHMFLIAALVFTKLLIDEIYHLNQSPIDLLMMWGWFFLFTCWFDSKFLLQLFDTGNRWNWTCIDYHACVTSEPTKLVCYSRQVRASYLFTQISWMNKFLPCGVMPSFWYVSPYFYEAI